MKKPMILTLTTLLAVGGTSVAIASTGANATETEPTLALHSEEKLVNEQEAAALAEAFIGGNVKDIEKDDDGTIEVEVKRDGEEFDVEILQQTGEIVNVDGNLLKIDPTNPEIISVEEAETAAKKAVNQEDIQKVELEIENGLYVYEIEFNVNGEDEDVKINAETGSIVSMDDVFKANLHEQGDLISIDEAKSIATGEFEQKATVTEIELDTDEGFSVYEMELLVDGVEYDVEIDAVSKAILKNERD
ncbi:PepSY domain-containing protein [Alkalicoccobacillus gibsonii]|uniref:PepSY domain-containing protein n=1 Tax=Alkalicoccobacillus gibsonii TaxID=79881 RepID=UPI0019318C3B|nr:PepSY domain-containing protein [Alkalicoccobacillus gibsonii]MBM0067689.1 PepSY domain-containing protein [Alkalicoccobacillus gibsonii]